MNSRENNEDLDQDFMRNEKIIDATGCPKKNVPKIV